MPGLLLLLSATCGFRTILREKSVAVFVSGSVGRDYTLAQIRAVAVGDFFCINRLVADHMHELDITRRRYKGPLYPVTRVCTAVRLVAFFSPDVNDLVA